MSHEGNHHDLATEFPQFKDKIHTLKINNAHFRTLFDRYQDLDKKISRSESRIELMSELEEEGLRKERLKLKDQLYRMLSA